MTIHQVNETGETVADLSPEPKKRKSRPQPEDQKPTDPNIPPIGTDIWLCEGGVWATKPRKVDKHGVTSNGDAFQVAGYSMWLMMKHLGEYWADSDPWAATVSAAPPNEAQVEELKRQFADSEALASKPHVPLAAAGSAQAEFMASNDAHPYLGGSGSGAVAPFVPVNLPPIGPAFPTGEISRNPEERTLPIPGTEGPAEPQEPSKKLDFTLGRHANLSVPMATFVGRILTWDLPYEWHHIRTLAERVESAWEDLGTVLNAAKIAGLAPKVTARSRLRSWLRPGAPVALRDDIAGIYAQMYSQEELGALEVMAVLDTKVALMVRGGRELGLVELAHVRKP